MIAYIILKLINCHFNVTTQISSDIKSETAGNLTAEEEDAMAGASSLLLSLSL